jgi:thiosulfate/3-mercaptopyruvate sulfurtransferase
VDPLITPAELLPHLDDPDWLVVDCSFDLVDKSLGQSDYLQGHIPGAVYADLERDLSARPNGRNGRHPLPSPEELARVLSRLGIDNQTMVVAYDRNGSPYAARLWWILGFLGGRCRVLDGGFWSWVEAGHGIRTGVESRATVRFQPKVDESILVTAAQVEAGLGTGRDLLIDARAAERYRGEQEPYDRVAGHIPGAANAFWKDNLDRSWRFESPSALRERYLKILGGAPSSAAVAYCGSGVSACHDLLAMAHAGLAGARLYAGSWSEWSSDPARLVAVGNEPATVESDSG